MARRRDNRPFGKYVEDLREARGLSQSDMDRFARQRHLRLTRNILINIENGQTKQVSPDALHAIAALLEIPYTTLLTEFVQRRYMPDGESLKLSKMLAGSERAHAPDALHAETGALTHEVDGTQISRREVAPYVSPNHRSIVAIAEVARTLGQLQKQLARATAKLVGTATKTAPHSRTRSSPVPHSDDRGTASERTRKKGA